MRSGRHVCAQVIMGARLNEREAKLTFLRGIKVKDEQVFTGETRTRES